MKKISILLAAILAISVSSYAQSWERINDGVGSSEDESMCSGPDGSIYVGGYYAVSTSDLAVNKWNGSVWNFLSGIPTTSLSSQIFTLCADTSGNIYAAGQNTDSVGADGYYVAKWNGSTWVELGTGSARLNAGGDILSICADKFGHIFAATWTPGDSGRNVYAWNGTVWNKLGGATGALNANGDINSICTDKFGNVYAGGVFTDVASAAGQHFVAKWDGTSWSELGGTGIVPINPIGIKSVIADSAGNIYAAGSLSNVSKWDGTSWSELGGTTGGLHANGSIWSICTDKYGNIYAAGDFTDSTAWATSNNYVAKWDGTSWSELGTGGGRLFPNGRIATVCSDIYGNVYACGLFTFGGMGFVGKFPNPATAGVTPLSETNELMVFPNPAHTIINISAKEVTLFGSGYSLFDCTGRIYCTGKLAATTTPIDISSLPDGIYLLRINGAAHATYKVVKQ